MMPTRLLMGSCHCKHYLIMEVFMYEDIFASIRQAAEKRNLRERTIQLYCSDVGYFLRCTNKPVSELSLEDADAFLTMKRLEGRSPETHNHYRSSIKFLYKRVLKIPWDDEEVPAMKRERNLPTVLTPQEMNAIIDATDNLKHKAIIATMYSSGLRVSEVIHLHYDDVSRTNMTIHTGLSAGVRQVSSFPVHGPEIILILPASISFLRQAPERQVSHVVYLLIPAVIVSQVICLRTVSTSNISNLFLDT